MTPQERIEKLKKFTTDPDFILMRQMFEDYLEPLKDIMTIKVDTTNDEIASEVRGRQLTIKGLDKFFGEVGIINKTGESKPVTFK